MASLKACSQIQILSAHALIEVNFWERRFIREDFSSSGVSAPSARSCRSARPAEAAAQQKEAPGRKASSSFLLAVMIVIDRNLIFFPQSLMLLHAVGGAELDLLWLSPVGLC